MSSFRERYQHSYWPGYLATQLQTSKAGISVLKCKFTQWCVRLTAYAAVFYEVFPLNLIITSLRNRFYVLEEPVYNSLCNQTFSSKIVIIIIQLVLCGSPITGITSAGCQALKRESLLNAKIWALFPKVPNLECCKRVLPMPKPKNGTTFTCQHLQKMLEITFESSLVPFLDLL